MAGRSVGVLFQGWASADRRDVDVLDSTLRAAIRADRLGFGVAWFTEQHAPMFGAVSGRIAAPQLLIARLAGSTEQIELGTAVRLIAGSDPERVAEELTMLDLLTGGRVRYGLGAGSAGIAGDPTLRERRRVDFRRTVLELIEILRSGAAGRDLGLRIPDLTDRLLVASVDPRSVELAARAGFGYFVGMFGGSRHERLVSTFRGLGGVGDVRASRLVLVGDDDASARRIAAAAASHFWARFQPPSAGWRAQVAAATGRWRLDDVIEQLGWVVGGPSTVSRELGAYVSGCGLDAIDVCFDVPGLPEAAKDHSMDVFAAAVLPRLREVLDRSRKSVSAVPAG